MQAIIMAGGFGTRLRPLTCNIPKPMVPLMNRPIIGHIVYLLKKHNFDDIIVMLFYQPDLIRNYLKDGSQFGVKIRYLLPELDLGTAGSVKFAQHLINGTVLVISGDLLTDADLNGFFAFHREKKGEASILLTRVGNPLPFGIVMTDKNGRITQFLEKPSWGEVFTDKINSGIYLLEPHILDTMKEETEYDFGKDIFPELLENNTKLLGYPDQGYWKDIGNLDEYLAVHQDCLSQKVKIELQGEASDGLYKGTKTTIGRDVQFLGNVVLGNNVLIEDGAFIQNAVIGNDSVIKKGSRIINTVIWDNVSIGNNSQAKNAVIASYTQVGKSAVISDKVFIGEEVIIGDHSNIRSQVKIWPKKTIANETILSTSLVWGDRWLRELFTDARVSGIANTEITPEFASRFGSALGAFFGVGASVYSSRENDNVSYMISNAVQAGLNSMGVNIEDLAFTPIPVVRQVLHGSNFQGGLHIRSSPYTDNHVDIILFDSNGLDLHTNKCKKVERLFFGEDYARVDISKIGTKDYSVRPIDIYRSKFLDAVDSDAFGRKRLKAVFDFSYGPASTIFPTIFSELDIDLITLSGYLSPSHKYPSKQKEKERADQLAGIVKSVGADVGFIIDQTCERLSLVDNRGRFFSAIDLLPIVAKLYVEGHGIRHLEQQKPEYIAAPLNAPSFIKKLAEEKGIGYYSCKSSHRSMIETAMLEGVGFVGGTLGGFIYTDFGYASDAMFAAVRILEMLIHLDMTLGELADTIPAPNIIKRDIACSWEEKGKVMGALMEATEGLNRELLHGIKVFIDDGWILFLPAKEEPLFTVTVEAESKERAEAIVLEWAEKIRAWRDA
ncbi:sugar phosphate nucleotidyltransferase [candidate division KSB1 bacterium]